jgi:hypothetical protein
MITRRHFMNNHDFEFVEQNGQRGSDILMKDAYLTRVLMKESR